MKLTPLDIKKQEFTRTFRGIDPQEVQGFLDMVADQWGGLLDENRRLEQNIRDMEAKLIHYRKIEEALQEALETARDNSHKTIENAQREAQIILKEARAEAEEIRGKAFSDHKRLKTDVTKIAGRRDEIMARLRAFLMSELEILARFEGQDPIGFIRLSAPEKRKLERPNVALDEYDDPGDLHDEDESSFPLGDGRAHQAPPAAPPQPARPAPAPVSVAPPPPPPPPSMAPQPAKDEDEVPGELGGLSSDELDFIKATVTTAAHNVEAEAFFKPAEPLEEEPWMSGQDDPFQEQDDEEEVLRLEPKDFRTAPSPFDEQPATPAREGGNWVRNPIISHAPPGDEHGDSIPDTFEKPLFGGSDDHDDLTATPEEIEKIRRILNDLD
ncbi:MAG: DivIVA domain-containing protein [Rhodothermales bacterium]